MRAAAVAIAVLFAATVAAQAAIHKAGRSDPAANAAGNDVMTVTNFADVPAEEPPADEPPPPGAIDSAVANALDAANMTMGPPPPAWMTSGTWETVATGAEGAVWYAEILDTDFTAALFQVQLRTDETPDPRRTANNTRRLAEIDCAGRRYRILRTTRYDDSGRATEANERGDGRLTPVTAGSVFAEVMATLCSHAAEQSSPSSNAM